MSLLSEVKATVLESSDLSTRNISAENLMVDLVVANNVDVQGVISRSTSYFTTATNITTTSAYANTYNGATLTVSLFTVDASNVGLSFLVTNVNATNLSVAAAAGQTIYSSTGAAALTPRVLNQGHSQIFNALQVGPTTYGWSML
jgi:hypothetical protein